MRVDPNTVRRLIESNVDFIMNLIDPIHIKYDVSPGPKLRLT